MSRKSRVEPQAPLELAVQFAVRQPWVPTRFMIALWAYSALGPRRKPAEFTVRVVGVAEGRRLNKQFRRKDYATNILSFPSTAKLIDGRRHLGDLVVCAPVLAREAQEQGKARTAHWAHMIVHGTLHLLGYDHERDADTERMERHEIKILKTLGYPNPYLID